MKVGLIGLGKMGLNLGKNLIDHKHDVVAFDLNTQATEEMKAYVHTTRLQACRNLFNRWKTPRILWIMVPHKVVDSVIF
ncbi:NAD(P)-binding domain-containing protein [Paenibacillus crassostreae]|uniref:NAD(P)-binding domain-containing protein n=1 Tax=Paenibacillus crassostreae TaxID=1763538 RepID=UPI000ACA6735|nr:NAD(P)-binding domain-containing protein [Paenibacillus crassostreae]